MRGGLVLGEVAGDLVAGASSSSGGSWVLQMSCAFQQRVWKRQAGGGLIGLGTSPWSRIRSRCVRREVSGTGTADISAAVYGCIGVP